LTRAHPFGNWNVHAASHPKGHINFASQRIPEELLTAILDWSAVAPLSRLTWLQRTRSCAMKVTITTGVLPLSICLDERIDIQRNKMECSTKYQLTIDRKTLAWRYRNALQ
jgi:hypothetical protein